MGDFTVVWRAVFVLVLGLGLELEVFCTSVVFYKIIQFSTATLI